MDVRVMVCIMARDRRRIAELCIPTVKAGLIPGQDKLCLYNDGSTEYGTTFLHECGADLVVSCMQDGIEEQRRRHFREFRTRTEFSHLYLTDADALHDPNWRTEALRLHEKYDGAPVCLYNTEAHERLHGNTIDVGQEVIWRRVAPGISYFLSRPQAEAVARHLDQPGMPSHWNWDWTTPMVLNNRMAIARTSYVDHIGKGGYHHPDGEGYNGGDRCLNPTPWLIDKRAEVVKLLEA